MTQSQGLILAVCSALLFTAESTLIAQQPRPAEIPGYFRQGDVYRPAEPYIEGRPRVSGLQRPFPTMPSVGENPVTPEKVQLGRLLFFDPIVGGDNAISCATCHHPDYGFSDGRKTSMGRGGRGEGPGRTGGHVLPRSAPTLWNAAYNKWQFWDGRAKDLEEQAAGPITTPEEMDENPERLVGELKAIAEYRALFQAAFGHEDGQALTFRNVQRAIATFERTLLSFNSRFDRYTAGDFSALNEQEKRGLRLFRSVKTRCFECHNFPTFADANFKKIGVPDRGDHDVGRAGVAGHGPDGGFKIPTLRNVELTAPYMHNGAFDTLEEVLDFYARGGGRGEPNPIDGIDDKIGKFNLRDQERSDLVAFLKTLTDTSLLPEAPERVPSGLPVVEVRSKASPAPPLVVRAAPPRARPATPGVRFPPRPPRPSVPATSWLSRPPDAGRRPTFEFGAAAQPTGSPEASAGPFRPFVMGGDRIGSNAGRRSASATFTVRPGQSIQAAIDRCRPGDRVELLPGVYHQSVVIDMGGITLVGAQRGGERAVLDGGGVLSDAIQATGGDLTIEAITVRNYSGNGIVVNQARNLVLRDLVAENTGLYGLYPVECTEILIEGCVVSGARDAGIYVGQSRDIVIRNNEVFGNVAGIEIENSVNALVANNSAHHNTGGILVFLLPDNPSKVGSHCRVINNRIWANNLKNFAKEGTIVSMLPAGTGMLVMAADHTEVTRNFIADNDSYGVAVVSLLSFQPAREGEQLDIEPNSDYTSVHDNAYRGNGEKVALQYRLFSLPGGDILWDETGVGNAWRERAELKTAPENLLNPLAPLSAPSTHTGGPK